MAYGSEAYGTEGYKGEVVPVDVALDGSRVFRWRPDWKDGIQLSYLSSTIISETQHYVEQRRAQYSTLKRRMSFAVADDEYLPAVEHFIRRWHSSVIWMPVWSERLAVSTASLQGETVIDVVDTANRFSLNTLGGHIVLIDRNLTLDPEIFALSAVGDTSVTLATAVSGEYTSANAMLFPAFSAFLDTNQITDITAKYASAVLNWREWF